MFQFEEVKREKDESTNGSARSATVATPASAAPTPIADDDKAKILATVSAAAQLKTNEDLKVKELMAQAQRAIDERKKLLNVRFLHVLC